MVPIVTPARGALRMQAACPEDVFAEGGFLT